MLNRGDGDSAIQVGGSGGRRAPALAPDFAGHRKECNPLDIGGSAARGDAAALLRARASMSDENIEVWEGMRRVTAWKLP